MIAASIPDDGASRRLTEKGLELLPVLVALMQWGDKWIFGEQREPLRILDKADKRPIRRITVTATDGRPLAIGDLRFRPGPGANKETLDRFAQVKHSAPRT